MKVQLVASALVVYTITSISLLAKVDTVKAQASPSSAGLSIAFSCKVIEKIPNTVARVNPNKPSAKVAGVNRSSPTGVSQTSTTQVISVIQWKRPQYPETNETPLERCIRVSNILQSYNYRGSLNYITYGEMDGRQVVCAASDATAPCGLLIFTLEKDDKPEQLVSDLRQVIKEPTLLISPSATDIANRWRGGGRGYSVPSRHPPFRTNLGASR